MAQAFDLNTYPIEEDKRVLTPLIQAVQEFGSNKDRLLPLMRQYMETTKGFTGRLKEITDIIMQKIGLINGRITGLNNQLGQLNQKIAELQHELENHPAGQEAQRLQQELARMTDAKNRLLGLLVNLQEKIGEFNQTVGQAPYNELTDENVRQLSTTLEAIITSLTEADNSVSSVLGERPGRLSQGGARVSKRRRRVSKNKNKNKSKKRKTAKRKRGKKHIKQRGGYSYGKSKRRTTTTSKSRHSSSSQPSSLI
jgi:cell fate (sporulation/competence/biofilm development) regulator YlbF (YheA/YmcA/DUF963 family)